MLLMIAACRILVGVSLDENRRDVNIVESGISSASALLLTLDVLGKVGLALLFAAGQHEKREELARSTQLTSKEKGVLDTGVNKASHHDVDGMMW